MDDDLVRGLQVMTAQLVGLSVVIHLVIAVRRLRAVLVSGTFPRLATVLFVLAILGVLAGAVAFRYDLLERRTLYRFFVFLMLAQVVGWLVYHNLDLLGVGHSHQTGVFESVLAHVEADVVEAAAKSAELLAALFLLVLLRVDPRVSERGSTTREQRDAATRAPRSSE